MLLGIAIMLAVITVHLFLSDKLITDFIAIIGMGIVVLGYCSRDGDNKPTK